jgi:hypothetical protein
MATRYYRETATAVTGDSTLLDRAIGFLVLTSADIVAEDPQTANHADRLAMATAIQAEAASRATLGRWLVVYLLLNATIRGKVAVGTLADEDDSDIEFVALQHIDTLADRWAAQGV